MKLVAISAGRKNGNNEILLKEAMMAASSVTVVEPCLIRLADLKLNPCTGCEGCMKRRLSNEKPECVQNNDDYRWLVDQIKDADALLLGAPIYDFIPSGNFIVLLNRGLGFGEPSTKTKVCSSISLGGSDWTDFTEPIMDLALRNLAEDASIIDKMVVGDYPAYQMVVLDDAILEKARNVGKNLANAFGNNKVMYKGEYGICPVCHNNLLKPVTKNQIQCPFCGAEGTAEIIDGDLVIDWNSNIFEKNRFSISGRSQHRIDIKTRHQWTAAHSSELNEKKKKYSDYNPVMKPIK